MYLETWNKKAEAKCFEFGHEDTGFQGGRLRGGGLLMNISLILPQRLRSIPSLRKSTNQKSIGRLKTICRISAKISRDSTGLDQNQA